MFEPIFYFFVLTNARKQLVFVGTPDSLVHTIADDAVMSVVPVTFLEIIVTVEVPSSSEGNLIFVLQIG
jgi:hypothetical protein